MCGWFFPNSRCKTSVLAVARGPSCIVAVHFPPANCLSEKAPDCAGSSFKLPTIFVSPSINRNWASPVIFGNSASVSLWLASPPVAPLFVPAVDEAVSQVWCAVCAVAQVPLTVNQPRIFIDRVSVLKCPGERCYSSG